MEEDKKNAYSEVVEILKLMDEERLGKIPFEFVQLIKSNSNPEYKPQISKDIPLEEQNLKDETYSILAWIADKYWGENIYSNQEIKENVEEENVKDAVIEKIEIDETANIRNAAVYNDIEPAIIEEVKYAENLPTVVSEPNWFQKIKTKIIRIIKNILKIKDMKKEFIDDTDSSK